MSLFSKKTKETQSIIDSNNGDAGRVVRAIEKNSVHGINRENIEQKAHESEEKFAAAFNTSPGLMAITRISDGKILEVNESYSRMLGYSRDESVGKTTAELSIWADAADRDRFVAALQKDGQVLDFETVLRRKDGAIITVIDSARMFDLQGKECILSTAYDITERKRLEVEREQYLKFFELSTDIMVIADPNGNFKKVNPTCLQVLGYTESELISKPFIDFVLKDDKQSTLDEMVRQIKSGSSLSFENRYVRKDGRVMRLSWHANYDKIEGITYATARDITERKEMEEKLRRNEEELNEAQRIGRIGNWDWDIATDTINWSKEYYSIIGFDPSQKPPSYEEHLKAYTPESATRLDAAVKKNTETGESYELDLEFANPKVPASRWIAARSESIRDEKGKIIGLRGTAQDITDRKLVEIELVKKNRMLRILSNVNQELIHAADETSLIDEISRIIVDIGSYHMLWIGFAEQDEAKTVRPVAQVGFGTDYLSFAKISWADDEHGRGPTGTAIRTGKTQISRDILKDPKMTPWREAAVKSGYKSSIALPLSSGDKPFGALNIYATETDTFNEVEVAILEEISKDLAFGITTLREDVARVEGEEELKKFKMAIDAVTDNVTITDSEGIILYANKGAEDVTGYSREESIGKKPSLWGGHMSKAFYEDMWKTIHEGKKPFKSELINRRKEGTLYTAELSISPIFDKSGNEKYFIGVERDITEAKVLANDLLKFKLALDNASDQVIITDPEGMVIYANAAVEKITGYKSEEAIGKKSGVLWKSPMPKEYYQEFWHTIKELKTTFIGEIQNKRKNGELYTAMISVSPVLDEKRDILFFVGLERDITKEKEIDTAKSEFISLASHQMRTPLTAINWYAEMLLGGDAGTLNTKQKEYFQAIYTAGQQMNEIIKSFLHILRLESGMIAMNLVSVNIEDVMRMMLKESQLDIDKKHLQVVEHYKESVPSLKIDIELIRVVLQNLISNAVKYTPEKGKITISLDDVAQGEIVAGKTATRNSLLVSIRDTGIGIPAGEQSQVFSKFFRAESAKRWDPNGNGLGLYMTNKMMDIIGGTIWFDSEEGKGTVFYALLPMEEKKLIQ